MDDQMIYHVIAMQIHRFLFMIALNPFQGNEKVIIAWVRCLCSLAFSLLIMSIYVFIKHKTTIEWGNVQETNTPDIQKLTLVIIII